jgi:hydroxymethylpyrimidine/phosphomethylpyrimidine kinase
MATQTIPCALTIAGSDSGGGAGIQADLSTFAAVGVHGTSVVACLTAQNPRSVSAVQTARPTMVRAQLQAVFGGFPVRACKTGMLYEARIIKEVAAFFRARRRCPLVVDPVMVATSGALLLKSSAVRALVQDLLPQAILITPNLPEAERLTGLRITEPEHLRAAARILVEQFGGAALVKGGHLGGTAEAMDLFFDGRNEWLLTAPRVRGVHTHGTGCTLSAAIVAYLARGCALPEAVAQAKSFLTRAIAHHRRVGSHAVLNWFWRQ